LKRKREKNRKIKARQETAEGNKGKTESKLPRLKVFAH